jgi:hypothetical protein
MKRFWLKELHMLTTENKCSTELWVWEDHSQCIDESSCTEGLRLVVLVAQHQQWYCCQGGFAQQLIQLVLGGFDIIVVRSINNIPAKPNQP